MNGQLSAVWSLSWKEIWTGLFRHKTLGDDLAIDMFREHIKEPSPSKPFEQLQGQELEDFEQALRTYQDAAADPRKAKAYLRKQLFARHQTESFAVRFIENSFGIFEDFDDQNFSNMYYLSLERFIRNFNLHYDLRRPLTLHPTLPAIFNSLLDEILLICVVRTSISRPYSLSLKTQSETSALIDCKAA